MLAINPFHGGSHRAFLEGVVKHSRHRWSIVTDKPLHWKWRMRASALTMSKAAKQAITLQGNPDLVFCTDMLDLPAWLAFMRDQLPGDIPVVIYFHENQWTYPTSPRSRVDFHYGYTNLLSAIAADRCLFNSQYHVDDFLKASEKFVSGMPDSKNAHDWDSLRQKCSVSYPGFDIGTSPTVAPVQASTHPLTIGWVSRWESDKRPDLFLHLCRRLRDRNMDFRLILLGAQPPTALAETTSLRTEFATQIIHDGYAESREDYLRRLQEIDIVVSTADHEFFGIAICEAIASGAIPIVPDRLSYPELVAPSQRYRTIQEAVDKIVDASALSADESLSIIQRCQKKIQSLQRVHTVANIDKLIDSLDNNTGGQNL